METMVSVIEFQGMKNLAIILAVVAIILGIVALMLNFQISKMLKEMAQMESDHQAQLQTVRGKLEDCEDENRELQRQKEEAEENAKNYKEQRDFLINSKKSEA